MGLYAFRNLLLQYKREEEKQKQKTQNTKRVSSWLVIGWRPQSLPVIGWRNWFWFETVVTTTNCFRSAFSKPIERTLQVQWNVYRDSGEEGGRDEKKIL